MNFYIFNAVSCNYWLGAIFHQLNCFYRAQNIFPSMRVWNLICQRERTHFNSVICSGLSEALGLNGARRVLAVCLRQSITFCNFWTRTRFARKERKARCVNAPYTHWTRGGTCDERYCTGRSAASRHRRQTPMRYCTWSSFYARRTQCYDLFAVYLSCCSLKSHSF